MGKKNVPKKNEYYRWQCDGCELKYTNLGNSRRCRVPNCKGKLQRIAKQKMKSFGLPRKNVYKPKKKWYEKLIAEWRKLKSTSGFSTFDIDYDIPRPYSVSDVKFIQWGCTDGKWGGDCGLLYLVNGKMCSGLSLIDCGALDDGINCLKKGGIKHVPFIVISHWHFDHVAGLKNVLSNIGDNNRMICTLEKHGNDFVMTVLDICKVLETLKEEMMQALFINNKGIARLYHSIFEKVVKLSEAIHALSEDVPKSRTQIIRKINEELKMYLNYISNNNIIFETNNTSHGYGVQNSQREKHIYKKLEQADKYLENRINPDLFSIASSIYNSKYSRKSEHDKFYDIYCGKSDIILKGGQEQKIIFKFFDGVVCVKTAGYYNEQRVSTLRKKDAENDRSLITTIDVGKNKWLLSLGDISGCNKDFKLQKTIENLLDQYKIIKLPHHGSAPECQWIVNYLKKFNNKTVILSGHTGKIFNSSYQPQYRFDFIDGRKSKDSKKWQVYP